MARIYKRPDRAEYYIDLTDARGIRRRLAGYASKPLTAELARRLEQLRDCRKAGMPLPDDVRRWLESQPPADIAKWTKWDLVEASAATASQPLRVHLDAWLENVAARKRSPKYITHAKKNVIEFLNDLGAAYWDDLSKDKIRRALEARAERQDAAAGTFNMWLKYLKAFFRWCVETDRAASNLVAGIKCRDIRADRRYVRRPLSPEELRRLIAAAMSSPVVFRSLNGQERALLYLVAASTGWRWVEISRLRRMDFLLDGSPPLLAPPASTQKGRREDKVPLRSDVAALLRTYFAENPAGPEARALPMSWGTGAGLLRFDLANTGDPADVAEAKRARGETPLEPIPYTDERGRVADFHSLRHALATMIGRAGVPIKLAQTIMRHSDPALTLGVYTHAEDSERAAALEALPALLPTADIPAAGIVPPEPGPDSGAAHGANPAGNHRYSPEGVDPGEPEADFTIVDDFPYKSAILGDSSLDKVETADTDSSPPPPTSRSRWSSPRRSPPERPTPATLATGSAWSKTAPAMTCRAPTASSPRRRWRSSGGIRA